ncbi:MAG TPA: type IV toxin-antitoxin system AbiEi family antitoxin domain-containing protein [Stellaceae bacterium]|nr:type IV toxin-antitoxin system AbiEi family antitoxin domain-containing protein [Stellaceae bacterium]
MEPARSPTDRALAVARTRGVARARDFTAAGIAPIYLKRLTQEGRLVRLGRGLYQLADAELAATHSLAETARVVPHGVICLLSALQFHELTTQTPHEVWVMIGLRKWAPTKPPVRLRIVRATGESLTAGVEHHTIEGVAVPVYEPAKTVADCFKYRSKVGLDVAIEALRDCRRRRLCTVDRLWHFARICRVQNVMRPYMEALL